MKNRVYERRKEMGLTQDGLAKAAQIGRSSVSEIESGSRLPRVDTAKLISIALKTTVDYLFYFEEER